MTYQGHVENGLVVLDAPVTLPEGAQVEVAVMKGDKQTNEAKPVWQLARELAASIPDEDLEKMPTDASINHDHYLYGAKKREP